MRLISRNLENLWPTFIICSECLKYYPFFPLIVNTIFYLINILCTFQFRLTQPSAESCIEKSNNLQQAQLPATLLHQQQQHHHQQINYSKSNLTMAPSTLFTTNQQAIISNRKRTWCQLSDTNFSDYCTPPKLPSIDLGTKDIKCKTHGKSYTFVKHCFLLLNFYAMNSNSIYENFKAARMSDFVAHVASSFLYDNHHFDL